MKEGGNRLEKYNKWKTKLLITQMVVRGFVSLRMIFGAGAAFAKVLFVELQ